MDENAIVNLFNGSKWQQSTPNKGVAGDAGFSVICSVGYEYKFALGFLFILSDNSTTVRKVLYAPATPTATDDTTLGFTTETTWEMADGTQYHCTDVTEGAAVWGVVPAFDPAAPGPLGDTTPDVVNTTKLNARDSSGTITASIDGADGTASFVSVTTPSLSVQGVTGGTTQIDSTGTLTSWSNAGSGQKWLKLDSNDDSVKLFNSAGGYYDPPTASINGADGSASFGYNSGLVGLYIDQFGNLTTNNNAEASLYNFNAANNVSAASGAVILGTNTGTAAWINGDGSASFASGGLQIDEWGNITTNSGASATLDYFNAVLQVNVGYASNAGTLNINNASDITTASIDGASGEVVASQASIGNGQISIGSDVGTNAWINNNGDASFANGNATIGTDGTLTLAGALIGGTQSLTTAGGAGAVNLTTLTTEVETTGTLDALTLANGTVGQIKVITHTVGAFTSVLTPTTALGFTTITFLASLGQTCTLEYTNAGWAILAVGGLTLPVVA